MYESGYYPAGAEHDPNAPWNQEDPVMVECDECNGTGYHSIPTISSTTLKRNAPRLNGKACPTQRKKPKPLTLSKSKVTK